MNCAQYFLIGFYWYGLWDFLLASKAMHLAGQLVDGLLFCSDLTN